MGSLQAHVPRFSAKIIGKEDLVKRLIYTMTFGMSDPVPGVQRYYSDISMIGRHFVVSNSLFPDKLRQYTICNCMEKSVYQEYLRLIETFKIVMRISSSQSPYRSPGLKKSGKGA